MKRLLLMLLALTFFLAAPALAQGDAGGAADNGSTAESDAGMPGDNEGDDAVEDPEVVGADEGEDTGAAGDDDAGLPGDNEGDDAVEDTEVVGADEGEDGEAAAGDDAAGDAAGDDAAGDDAAADDAAADDAAAEGEVAGGGTAEVNTWTFAAFDANADGFLTSGEFGTGFFNFLSGETPGLSQDRYQQTIDTFGVTDAPDFEQADVNGDGVITGDQEFIPAVAVSVFEQWDSDGDSQLSTSEFSGNMLAAFDANGDGTLGSDEFEAFASFRGADSQEVAGGGAAEGFGEDFFLGEEVDATEQQDVGGEAGPADPADDATDDDAMDDATDDAMDDADTDDATDDPADDAMDDATDDGAMDDDATDDAGTDDAMDDAGTEDAATDDATTDDDAATDDAGTDTDDQ